MDELEWKLENNLNVCMCEVEVNFRTYQFIYVIYYCRFFKNITMK